MTNIPTVLLFARIKKQNKLRCFFIRLCPKQKSLSFEAVFEAARVESPFNEDEESLLYPSSVPFVRWLIIDQKVRILIHSSILSLQKWSENHCTIFSFLFCFLFLFISVSLHPKKILSSEIRKKESMASTDTSDRKVLIDQACRTAKDFIDIYYDKVDTKRHTVSKTYLDTATLSWNGNKVCGKNNLISIRVVI